MGVTTSNDLTRKLLERCLTKLRQGPAGEGSDDLIQDIEKALKVCSGCGYSGDEEFWKWHFPCDYDPML